MLSISDHQHRLDTRHQSAVAMTPIARTHLLLSTERRILQRLGRLVLALPAVQGAQVLQRGRDGWAGKRGSVGTNER